ncbi:Actin cytoskeleton organization protein App1, putative [Penicillium digitatum]|uniref:Actin cytoskeleton organization protein App1, putative n=3 Tax=Penicillium digitatum TaxID=36651 RepID=K9GA08_PEND2|nr:Actin cytoskeleton organization protein App1, putative [Penicillium digitatum Pd1]EKV15842.1 Actin cytoskeleton organization protein App1, putative [Penicillium digitatum Pd1]EKV17907.1 Actin cytoskeleton organization protein App1, putative [Penicillium digitatum PHI26]QQK42291.1 Actin cytoskeleton organization protein App1, putative [Penicillium digitatum]
MSQSGLSSTCGPGSGDGAAASGSRRKKVYEYFKAANELRQAYTSQWSAQRNEYDEDYYNTPGAFPDVEMARSGNEEMVVFPSYARRLAEKRNTGTSTRPRRDSWSETIDDYRGATHEDGHLYTPSWDAIETEDSVVAVDVRGWIYSPGRGPMSRKHRLMIALARKLSGISAPTGTANDESNDKISGKGDDEYIDKEIQTLVAKAEKEADPAWKGSNAEQKNQPATPLSKDEISVANAHLMERLRPFLTNPVGSMPVTVFFFNDDESKSRNILTDESGHFTLRATLPFVPTHIRVLASEDLSVARPIEVIDPVGISLISDIDDTVKHSAIASGAKEMFRNTFIRELGELTVEGVSDWYRKMANEGVQIHYVSNAPWQLYPLLERYFKIVGLPPGSFHLKQYSGMLQGIFEPTAERKRGSLEQILRDFPERKFILVGDSGEADLEVYTEIVLANPGQILGVFIRDVTTSETQNLVGKAVGHLDQSKRSRSSPHVVDHSDAATNRPMLPPRRGTTVDSTVTIGHHEPDPKDLDLEDLIDLTDLIIGDQPPPAGLTHPATPRPRPAKPIKPSALRMVSTPADLAKSSKPSSLRNVATLPDVQKRESKPAPAQEPPKRKPVPPVPPRRGVPKTDILIDLNPSHSTSQSNIGTSMDEIPSSWLKGYDDGSAGAQSQSQGTRAKPPPPRPPPRRTNTGSSTTCSDPSVSTTSTTPVLTPAPASGIQSYSAAAAQAAYQGFQYASDRFNFSGSASGLRNSQPNRSLGRTGTNESGVPPAPVPNKREELWRRRWDRASEVLEQHGVVLGCWRVGEDAQPVCAWLLEQAVKDIKAARLKGGH